MFASVENSALAASDLQHYTLSCNGLAIRDLWEVHCDQLLRTDVAVSAAAVYWLQGEWRRQR